MKSTPQHRELISALMDGQLSADELAQGLQACEGDGPLSGSWNTYHLIGEVLRSPLPVSHGADSEFVSRLSARLANEPAPLPEAGVSVRVTATRGAPAANDGVFRWKMVAGFASLAAVAAVAWTSFGLVPPAGPQIAESTGSDKILVASPQGTMVRDARLEELLAAHKQFGGTSALQVPSGFLRNATFETPPDARR